MITHFAKSYWKIELIQAEDHLNQVFDSMLRQDKESKSKDCKDFSLQILKINVLIQNLRTDLV